MTSQPALIVDTMLAEVRDGIAQYGTARTAPEEVRDGIAQYGTAWTAPERSSTGD